MNERVKKMIKPMILAAALFFALFWFILKPKMAEDYFSCVGYSISVVLILFVLYERILWRFIPWNRPPLLKKEYAGTFTSSFDKQKEPKPIEITVKQTWLTVSIKTKTDINSSSTITGSIVSEHGDDVLYYNYITDPDAMVQKNNPIQYGTCRMMLEGDNSRIHGKYWTTRQTIGDIEWKEKPNKKEK